MAFSPPAPAVPYLRAAAGRCPNCGRGPLFAGFLAIRPVCSACGFDLSRADSGDGPAVFVILVAGAVACFGALWMDIAVRPPIWVHLVLWLPLSVALSLGLLRPFKGLLVAAQFVNRASQASNHGP